MTDKQARFCEEYLIDLNATQAAIRAGYSPKAAKEQGCQLLIKLNTRARIDSALTERSKRIGVTVDKPSWSLLRLLGNLVGREYQLSSVKNTQWKIKCRILACMKKTLANKAHLSCSDI